MGVPLPCSEEWKMWILAAVFPCGLLYIHRDFIWHTIKRFVGCSRDSVTTQNKSIEQGNIVRGSSEEECSLPLELDSQYQFLQQVLDDMSGSEIQTIFDDAMDRY